MANPLTGLLENPWGLVEMAVDGPLHPGGTEATEALLDRAGVDETTRLLDVGCGAGNALELARERGARAVGLDQDPPDRGAVRGDLSSLPFEDDSFDVVLGECVLCLSPDLDRTLAEIARVLAPDGRLALSDVTVSGAAPELPAPIDEMLCLNRAHERERLRERVADTGFSVGDVRTHREDLLAMRDELLDSLDTERLMGALGERGTQLADGATDLEAAVEEGRVGYVSLVATRSV